MEITLTQHQPHDMNESQDAEKEIKHVNTTHN